MPVDEDLLLRHRSFEDASIGITEAFLQPTIGSRRTVAVLSRPMGSSLPVGWIILHSFGLEQMHLSRLDVVVARALAAAGFPVLRFHGQGYGDSEATDEPIGLASHLADASDAVRLLSRQPGIERVGVLGARFGGTVAALVAEREGLELMGLWEPMERGSQYLRDFLRARVFAEMVGQSDDRGAAGMEQLRAELASQGWSDIKGIRLSREASEDIGAIDLTKDLTRFSGLALLIGVSRSGRPSAGLRRLEERLTVLGARCTVRSLDDHLAAQFGQFHFQTTNGGRGKIDTQYDLNQRIASATAAWALAVHKGGLPESGS